LRKLRKQKRKPYAWLKEHRQKKKPRRFYQRIPVGLVLIWLVLSGIALTAILNSDLAETPWDKVSKNTARNAESISCYNPRIIDGDTFDCGNHRIRLANIDTPEISDCRPGRQCVSGDPYAAKRYLQSLTSGAVNCVKTDTGYYGRTIALCEAKGIDLSCAMVEANHGIERYGTLRCP
jgi:endonuclease YncB( thermonuclease family)